MRDKLRAIAIAAFGLSMLAGCTERDGPAENFGEQIDDAVEDAGDRLEEAGDEVQEAADEVGDALQDD